MTEPPQDPFAPPPAGQATPPPAGPPAGGPPSGYAPLPGYTPPPTPPAAGYGPPPGWDAGAQQAQPGWGPPPGQPGWGAPQNPWAGQTQTETKAVVALVLAIAAYTFVPFLAAIAALVLANMAKRDIDASGGRLQGRGLAVTAFWLSVVHLAFVALLFVGFVLLVAVGGVGLR